MNPQTRADQALESWLADGPERMPEHLVDSIVSQLEQTHQRKHLWLPGREQMNRIMVAVGGVAAVALLAVVGLYVVGRGGGIGGQPTPSPTPIPTALPTSGAVLPGRYFVDSAGYRYTFTVGDATWDTSVALPNVLVRHDPGQTEHGVLWLWGPLSPSDSILYTNPCQWLGTDFLPGPSVDDYATALTTLGTWRISQPAPVTVGGYSGKEVILTVPANADFSNCSQGKFSLSDGRWMQGAGQVEDMRILDFSGARYLVITSYLPGAPPNVRDQLDQMVNSMEITPVTP